MGRSSLCRYTWLLGGLVLLVACLRKDVRTPVARLNASDFAFPEVPYAVENLHTAERFALGKKLFFDPILSIDSTLSCASCHKPSLAFSDSVPFSPGVMGRPGTRNAPSLANVAFHPYFLKEGGVPTLEMQVLVPIQEHNEFAHNIVDIAEQLKKQPDYVRMCQEAYGRAPDAFTITRALGVFERALISKNSAFDRYVQGEHSAMSKEALKGMALFFSDRVGCTNCHSGPNFTQYAFETNGTDTTDGDIGRMRFSKLPTDRYRFKVPSLRNVELTAPYMHDGRLATLVDVVEHYNGGGHSHAMLNDKIKPLGLSAHERTELVAFLHSLSDTLFVQDMRWAY